MSLRWHLLRQVPCHGCNHPCLDGKAHLWALPLLTATCMGLASYHWKGTEWELKWVTREYGQNPQSDVTAELCYLSHWHGLWGREGRKGGGTRKSSKKVLDLSSGTFLLLLETIFSTTGLCWPVDSALREKFKSAPCALWQELRRTSINASPWSLPVFLLTVQMGQRDPSPQELQDTGLTCLHVFSPF